jgi:spore coat polysaccharide biosynthesis protein SpsF
MNKIDAFIVARQSSSRLPGKALVLVEGKPLLQLISERLRACPEISEVWFVTSNQHADDGIEDLASRIGVRCHRGHPDDVLNRLYTASLESEADAFLEVGGDCPLIDPTLVGHGVKIARASDADFTSNAFKPPFSYPVGYDFILIKKEALHRLHGLAELDSERCQPFQFVIRRPELFTQHHFSQEKNLNQWRFTLDYPEDLKFIEAVFYELYENHRIFGFQEIEELLQRRPDIVALNSKYATPVAFSTIWFTGSYTTEVGRDIERMLKQSAEAEASKDWQRSIGQLSIATQLLEDLLARANYFEKKGADD